MTCLTFRKALSRFTQLALLLQVLNVYAALPANIRIPDSTPIQLTMMDRLNSSTSELDDPVHFEVAEDVKVEGIVVIPRGSMAIGHVLEVQHRQRMGKAGRLVFSVDFVKAPDGSNISVREQAASKGRSKRSGLTTPMRVLAKGKDLEIPQGTHILAYVNGNHDVLAGNSSLPPESQATVQVMTAVSSTDVSSVVVSSAPNHADITVDGKFLGTTPSTVRIASGDHSVTIEKDGFKAWQRVMTLIPGGSITLDVTLDKIP